MNLSLAGMEVIQAQDGGEGLELAKSENPDLVLLDLMMPRVDGWTAAQGLMEDEGTRRIPFLFLTARATAADRRRAEELGALGYILKPFDPVKLPPLVADVVARCARGEAEDLRRERPAALWPADLEDR